MKPIEITESEPSSERPRSPHESSPQAPSESTLDGAHFAVSELADADEVVEIDVDEVIDLTDLGEATEPAGALEPAEGAALTDELARNASDAAASEGGETDVGEDRPTRRRLEEQLEALKRKEAELRRALVIADHPELGDAIRALQGRAYAIGRAETKLAQGLSKAEERRRETIEKKLLGLRGKRAELDAQIDDLEQELSALGAERIAAFELERQQALEQLLVALGTHEPALLAAGVDAGTLVPELAQWLPQIESLAESLVAQRDLARAAAEGAVDADALGV